MRLILYSKQVRIVSGVQTFERAFLQHFNKDHEIIYLYDVGDGRVIEEFSKYATVVRNQGQRVVGDVCIYSTVFTETPNIDVKTRIQVIHTDLDAYGLRLKNKNIDKFVSVSKHIQEVLKSKYGIDSVVIPNMMPELNPSNVLRLMTASRLAEGKGFDRMLTLVERLEQVGRPFIYEIYGDGASMFRDRNKKLFNNPHVHLFGDCRDVTSYMLANDYVVQLSDHEGFCYSIHEALTVGIPVIVTDWEGVRETVEDGVNGYILKHDLSNLDINKLYNFDIELNSLHNDTEDIVKNIKLKWTKLLK